MNISSITDTYTHNEAAREVTPQRGGKKKKANFDIFDISNHQDKIVSKNPGFRNEFQFEGNEEDLKALRGNILEMDSLHLAKTRCVKHVDKTRLDTDDIEESEAADDFEDDGEYLDTYEVPLKRLSSGKHKLQIHRIQEENDTTSMQEFRQRVEDTLCVDSLHLNRERFGERT